MELPVASSGIIFRPSMARQGKLGSANRRQTKAMKKKADPNEPKNTEQKNSRQAEASLTMGPERSLSHRLFHLQELPVRVFDFSFLGDV